MLIYAVAIWVFAATIVALLPMRRQFVPGVVLLAAAPFLIAWVGWVYGWVAGLLALAGFGCAGAHLLLSVIFFPLSPPPF